MPLNPSNPARLVKTVTICMLSMLLLFYGFYLNKWNVADTQWFVEHQRDMESYVVGRLVKSRQDGILSAGGLTGVGSPNTTPVRYQDKPFEYQYSAYLNGLSFGAYTPYKSQIGGQGIFFSVLDNLIPNSSEMKLQGFQGFTSLLSALVLTMIILWFFLEFGWVVALFVLGSMVFSQWLVVFGRNLWWSIWAFFLPMLVLMYSLRRDRRLTRRRITTLVLLVFVAVLMKCLVNGYEYITTTLLMMMVPIVYYSVLYRRSIRGFIEITVVAVVGSFAAILLSMAILSCQIASVEGNVKRGVAHIKYSLKKRTHADVRDFPPEMTEVFESRIVDVVGTYLDGTFFDANNFVHSESSFVSNRLFRVRYYYLIVLFMLASAAVHIGSKNVVSVKRRDNSLALISATWFSILAPLSWHVIFKAHSYIHTHMNYIVWQMPFTFFGFAVCGLAIRVLVPVLVGGGSCRPNGNDC